MKTLTQRLLIVTTAVAFMGAMPAMAHMKGEGHSPEKRAERMEKMEQRMAEKQAELKAALQLTPAQEVAWTSYTQAIKPKMGHGQHGHKRAETGPLSTPERLEKMQARQAERSERLTQVVMATKTFYQALTPAQQSVFDQQALRMGHRGRHGGQKGEAGHGSHHRGMS